MFGSVRYVWKCWEKDSKNYLTHYRLLAEDYAEEATQTSEMRPNRKTSNPPKNLKSICLGV